MPLVRDEGEAMTPEASAAQQRLFDACDRICGKYAKHHKDRCPLYKANCAAMDAMNRKAQ